MASAHVPQSGGSGRRSLDAEINLVPFIDLLSMCICFLLMTAVWIELSSVQVKQANGTEGAAAATQSLDLDAKFLTPERMVLTLKRSGQTVKTIDVANLEALEGNLKALQSGLKTGEEIGAVMLTPKDGVDYGTLVNAMDVFRKNRLVNIGVIPVNPATGG